MNWLIFCQAPNSSDFQHMINKFLKMKKTLSSKINVFIILFGPNLNSECNLYKINHDSPNEIIYSCPGHFPAVKKMKRMIDELNNVKIDAIDFYFHSAGFSAGVWKGKTEPFMNISDLHNGVVVPLNPKLVIFDACYQGNMSCLFEMNKNVKVVVASSAYHPYFSMIETETFTRKICDFSSKKKILEFAHKLCHDWNALSASSVRSLQVYDMKYIPKIAERILNLGWDVLNFEKSRILKEDNNLYDLYSSCQDNIIRGLIEKSVSVNCKSCKKVVKFKGMSIEKRIPVKWRSHFLKSKWAKEIALKAGIASKKIL